MQKITSRCRARHLSVTLAGAAMILAGIHGSALAQDAEAAATAEALKKATTPVANVKPVKFEMVRSAAATAAGCATGAKANVTIRSAGENAESLSVFAQHLPPNTEFDLFAIQVPNTPFGVSWYVGDLHSNGAGIAIGVFISRFSIETFAVAPGTAAAPQVHSGTFPDASSNPPFAPVHTYHLGLWFNSPTDASNAGCPNGETPFNGDHTAGIQVLSTQNFANDQGPLRQFNP